MTCLPWGRGYQDEDIPEDPGDSGAAGVPVQFRAALADVLGAKPRPSWEQRGRDCGRKIHQAQPNGGMKEFHSDK